MEASKTIYYSSIILISLIYCTLIFILICIIQFFQIFNFDEAFFQCRQPILNIIYIISFLFVLYVLHPVTLFLSNIYGIESSIPLLINDIADIFIFLMFFPRAWILWYDRSFVDNIKNWLWRREINGEDQTFLVQYRGIMKLSHLLVYAVYLLLVAPLFVTLHILPYLNIIPFYCHIMSTILLMLLLCSTFYVIKSISIVSDEWSIRTELLSTMKTAGISYIIGHAIYVIFEYYINQKWALFGELLFICIADIFVIYYTCYWTRKKFQFLQKVRLMHTMKATNGRRSSFYSFLTKRVQFQQIMNHRNGIEAFCNHLSKEFGLESMLFVIEVIQFKGIIRTLSNGTFTDNVAEIMDFHAMPHKKEHVFSAACILNVHWLPIDPRMYSLTPYQLAFHLNNKYIEESADLCINISFGIRKGIYSYFQQIQIDNDMNTLQLDIIYKIFDEALSEIWRLIKTDSFLRFQSTEEFRRLVSVLFPDEAIMANKNLIQRVDDEIKKEKEKNKENINELTPLPALRKINSSNHKKHGIIIQVNNDFAATLTPTASATTTRGDALIFDPKMTELKSPTLHQQQGSERSVPKILKLHHQTHSLPIEGNGRRRSCSDINKMDNCSDYSKYVQFITLDRMYSNSKS